MQLLKEKKKGIRPLVSRTLLKKNIINADINNLVSV